MKRTYLPLISLLFICLFIPMSSYAVKTMHYVVLLDISSSMGLPLTVNKEDERTEDKKQKTSGDTSSGSWVKVDAPSPASPSSYVVKEDKNSDNSTSSWLQVDEKETEDSQPAGSSPEQPPSKIAGTSTTEVTRMSTVKTLLIQFLNNPHYNNQSNDSEEKDDEIECYYTIKTFDSYIKTVCEHSSSIRDIITSVKEIPEDRDRLEGGTGLYYYTDATVKEYLTLKSVYDFTHIEVFTDGYDTCSGGTRLDGCSLRLIKTMIQVHWLCPLTLGHSRIAPNVLWFG